MEEQRVLSADNAIDWKNILLVERLKTGSVYAFTVHFVDEQSATYHQSTREGEALLKHWEKYAPELSDNTERIPVG